MRALLLAILLAVPTPAAADVLLGASASYLRANASGAEEHHLAIAPEVALGRRVRAGWRGGARPGLGVVTGQRPLVELRALAEARWTGARWGAAVGAGLHVLARPSRINPDRGTAVGLRIGRAVAARWSVEVAVTTTRFAAGAWIATTGLAITRVLR